MPVKERIQMLLIEDDPDDVSLMSEVLRNTRIPTDLHVAMDGEEAMHLLRREGAFADTPCPDVVLLDLNLPKKDGRQVLTEIKSDPKLRRIPVIVMTTSGAEQDVLHAYDKHANAFVRKPIGYRALLDVVVAIEHFWVGSALLPPNGKLGRLPETSGPGLEPRFQVDRDVLASHDSKSQGERFIPGDLASG
jgi:chemotaxis family two-component system response regulator Rcp1